MSTDAISALGSSGDCHTRIPYLLFSALGSSGDCHSRLFRRLPLPDPISSFQRFLTQDKAAKVKQPTPITLKTPAQLMPSSKFKIANQPPRSAIHLAK